LSGLDAFVEALDLKRVHACTVCKLHAERPELHAEIVAGRMRRPVPHSTPKIAAYLSQQHGLKITPNMIRDHFLLNHEERFK
jgi:hypothetical protein